MDIDDCTGFLKFSNKQVWLIVLGPLIGRGQPGHKDSKYRVTETILYFKSIQNSLIKFTLSNL